jgi:hypothetical protein
MEAARPILPGNLMVVPNPWHVAKKNARDLLVFDFYFIFMNLLPIRQIDHPFIPLSFHWNIALLSRDSCICAPRWFL